MSNILVGTSSWTDQTLIESGRFYPRSATTPEDRLRYDAWQFPIVEIDGSYYGIPIEANARLWIERTPLPMPFGEMVAALAFAPLGRDIVFPVPLK